MEPLDRDALETILKRTGTYDEQKFSNIDLFERPSWADLHSRIAFELGWFGTSGFWIYEAKGARIGLAIHRGTVRDACVYQPEPYLVSSAAELEDAIIEAQTFVHEH